MRPQELVLWGRKRGPMPSIDNVSQFQADWKTWWCKCQPEWRRVEGWPLSRDEAKDKDWTRINCTGPHGLFAFVISASWWASSANLDSHHASLDAAIADLHWVIENLLHFNSRSQVTQSEAVPAHGTTFPGHANRESGKRKVKPSYKATYGK